MVHFSREFVSLLACIGADGSALPPALIYRGDSGSLQDTWLEDWIPEQEAFFGVSSNGWSSDSFGRNWLEKIFNVLRGKKQAIEDVFYWFMDTPLTLIWNLFYCAIPCAFFC